MKIGIIGCGAMGSAIGHALKDKHDLWFVDLDEEKARKLALAVGGSTRILQATDILILAIKPQEFNHFQLETKPRLLVSILTGVTLKTLKRKFPEIPILRMMPNLSIRYGNGIVALAEDTSVDPWKNEIVSVFSSFGTVKWLPESQFNAITALTGSGPAFFFALIEAMIEAGVTLGFSETDAYDLVMQMAEGSLATLQESGARPAELIRQVTSPNGTTLAGLQVFKEKKVGESLIKTFQAACDRSKEMEI